MGKWILVDPERNGPYVCGLRPGDRVRLKETIRMRTSDGKLTGKRYNKGGIWTVERGACILARTTPGKRRGEVFFRTPNGSLHTWDDDKGIYEVFTRPQNRREKATVRSSRNTKPVRKGLPDLSAFRRTIKRNAGRAASITNLRRAERY